MNVRREDVDVALSQGSIQAAIWNADVYLSIYSNACTAKSKGITVFESVDLENEVLAGKIANAIAKAMQILFGGVKSRENKKYPDEDYYTYIDKRQDLGIPYVFLIERGFRSNPLKEAKKRCSNCGNFY